MPACHAAVTVTMCGIVFIRMSLKPFLSQGRCLRDEQNENEKTGRPIQGESPEPVSPRMIPSARRPRHTGFGVGV